MNPVGFNIISDLHVDHLQGVDFPRLLKPSVRAKYLLISGDLGNPYASSYAEFLQKASAHYEWIFLVSGNHELYFQPDNNSVEGKTYDERFSQMKKVASTIANVKFLEQESFTIPGTSITIMGCILWSYVDPSSERMVERMMSDYSYIYVERNRPATVSDLRSKHMECVAWLLRSIDSYQKKLEATPDPNARLIVMTHHLPSFKLINPHYKGSPINAAFATDLESVCLKPPVHLWTCGHSHFFRRMKINGVDCVLNPSGMDDEDTSVQRGMVYNLE